MTATSKCTIRPLRDGDSLEALTALLNRAYKTLADMGLRYTATWQDVEITRQRIAKGKCLVAEIDGRVIGTISYYPPGIMQHPVLKISGAAHFGQLGVEPEYRSHGIGRALVDAIESLAREDHAQSVTLDTAIPARHLIEWYQRLGYTIVDEVQWDDTNYRSVIMQKQLDQ